MNYFGQPYNLCVYIQDTKTHLILVSPDDNFETSTSIALPSTGQCEGLSFAKFKVAVVISRSIYQFCLSKKNGDTWSLDELPHVIPVPQEQKIDILWDPESQIPYLLSAEISTLQEYSTMVQRNDLILVTKPNEVQLIRWPGHDRKSSSQVFNIYLHQLPSVKSFWAGDFLNDSTIAIMTTSKNEFSREDSFNFTVLEIRPQTREGWEYLCTFPNTCVSNATEENASFKTLTLVGGALPAAVIWNPGSETIGIVAQLGPSWKEVKIIYAVVDEDAEILQMNTITGLCGIPDSQGTTINRIAVTQDDGKLHLIKTDLSELSIVPEELQYGELPILTTPAEILDQLPDTSWQHEEDDYLSKDQIDDEDRSSDQASLSAYNDTFGKTASSESLLQPFSVPEPKTMPETSPQKSSALSPQQSGANDGASMTIFPLTTVVLQKNAIDRDVSSYEMLETNLETSRQFSAERNTVEHPSCEAQEEEFTGLLDNRKQLEEDIVEANKALDVAERARRKLKLVERDINAEALTEKKRLLAAEQMETDDRKSSGMQELEDSLKPWHERLKSIVGEISEMAGSTELDSVRSVQDETVGILEDCQTSLTLVNFQKVANRVKDLQIRVDSTARIIGRVAAAYDRVFSLVSESMMSYSVLEGQPMSEFVSNGSSLICFTL